ncbi:hypothetical protein SOASR030_34670 [Leminorella grimontii]|uniref:DUF1795 domain-containing protein n=2 Tax=Leminorella grimontii TaxID=82981 RepID=A0AAV5N5U4_9GAMM|nr:hypothetical protein [Leminorella grimontii]KFC93376.1 putative exported protein [Leminorella grimontii ATCC 33999 = DSM 5078]GKX57355.1 hypothetical protein SOASR030_34670 [Leminorella grimontii]VFS54877.1 Uncharacterised protein [Leminorella grimontii]
MNKTWKWLFSISLSLFFSFQAAAQVEMENQKIPSQGISINVPKGFTPMDEAMKKVKYPSENRPAVVFTDERGKVNVALSAGKAPLKAEQLNTYKDYMLQAMRNYHPAAESVTIDGNRKAWLIHFTSKAIDTDIHNAMLVTSYKDKMVLVAFNCTADLWSTYKSSVKASLLSIKFDEQPAN